MQLLTWTSRRSGLDARSSFLSIGRQGITHMNEAKEQEATVLGRMLAEHEKALQDAVGIVKREQPIVENLRRTVASLMGRPPKSEWAEYTSRYSTVSSILHNGGGKEETPIAAQDSIPKRKPEYGELTHIQSVLKAMQALVPDGSAIHVDQIVRETYFPIPNRDVFYRIKRTVVSEILRGMGKHLFVRGKKPNTFALDLKNKAAQVNA
jgi:hypothetical protein